MRGFRSLCSRVRLVCARLALSASLGWSYPAFAQSDQDTASARAAATAGAQAFEAGNWKRAVDYFERAEALVHSPVHLWYMASASAKLGRLVAAQEKCNKVRREGLPSGASSGLVNAFEGCGDLLADLEGRVPTVNLEVSGLPDDADFELTRNGTKIASATVGVPVPVDPGAYSFEGLADGYKATASVTVSEGQKKIVALVFAPDASVRIHAAQPPEASGTKAAPAAATQPTPPAERRGTRMPPPAIGSYLTWVLGAGAIGAGAAFTVLALDSSHAIEAQCGADRSCPAGTDEKEITELLRKEQLYYILSGVGYGLGGLGIASGFLIWALEPRQQVAKTAPRFQIAPVIGFQHVGVVGRF